MVLAVTVKDGTKLVLETGDVVKCLWCRNGGSNTLTMHDNSDSNYQVPVDKKFIGNYLYVVPSDGANCEFLLWDSNSTDSASGTKLIGSGFRTKNAEINDVKFPVSFEVAAGQYINFQEADSGSSSATLIGVETDA